MLQVQTFLCCVLQGAGLLFLNKRACLGQSRNAQWHWHLCFSQQHHFSCLGRLEQLPWGSTHSECFLAARRSGSGRQRCGRTWSRRQSAAWWAPANTPTACAGRSFRPHATLPGASHASLCRQGLFEGGREVYREEQKGGTDMPSAARSPHQ